MLILFKAWVYHPKGGIDLPGTSSESRYILVICGLELLLLHILVPTADKSIFLVCKSKALFTWRPPIVLDNSEYRAHLRPARAMPIAQLAFNT